MILLVLLACGAAVYCLLVLLAGAKYQADSKREVAGAISAWPPLSILKPLKGVDQGLEENLRSFFTQCYQGEFEIVFAVAAADDPARQVVDQLAREYQAVRVRTLVVGPPPWNNAKVWSLDHLVTAAAHDLLVMADSDIRVGKEMLETVAREFMADRKLGVATCPYRAVGGPSIWSELEALGMNTEFLAGVLVARMLEGMRFTLGPTVVARKAAIEAVGGWKAFQNYLAEDFVLGQRVCEEGWNSKLSRYVVEHRIGSEPLAKNFAHRLRWNRSTRRSRPAGYVGQFFTNPLPIFLLAWPATGWSIAFLGGGVLLRLVVGAATAVGILKAPMRGRDLWQLPVQDLLSFGFWIAGFFGNEIEWRGRIYILKSDGTFEPK